jgi:hypothetical protein
MSPLVSWILVIDVLLLGAAIAVLLMERIYPRDWFEDDDWREQNPAKKP